MPRTEVTKRRSKQPSAPRAPAGTNAVSRAKRGAPSVAKTATKAAPKAAAGPAAKRAPAKKKPRSRYSARTADRYELYQLAVQSPENDIAFLRRVYRRANGRPARHFREDFCGTGLMCATWAGQGKDFTAEGFDLDPEPVAWGNEHNVAPLGAGAERVRLHVADARAPGDRRPDIRVAQNFSYCILKERAALLEYFRLAHASLAEGGIFALDLYGGTESTVEMEEPRKIEGGFTYVWDQAQYLPGSGDYTCHIHFRFRDGTQLRKAFTYHWRYYTMSELKDLLAEAGFTRVSSYFEQTDSEDGSGNGVFVRDDTGATCLDCAGWIAYIIAQR